MALSGFLNDFALSFHCGIGSLGSDEQAQAHQEREQRCEQILNEIKADVQRGRDRCVGQPPLISG
jgi:hypothetical protein